MNRNAKELLWVCGIDSTIEKYIIIIIKYFLLLFKVW